MVDILQKMMVDTFQKVSTIILPVFARVRLLTKIVFNIIWAL